MDVDSPALDVTKRVTSKKDVQKTHLPSPSPSLTSARSTPTVNETKFLLNKFKKPTLPAASRETPDARGRTVESRASSCSFVTAPDKAAPLQRQSSVVSQRSSISTTSRKRKQIDLSDDEQSDYLPPSPSSFTARRESATPLGSSLKRPLKPKGPPPPSVSSISPTGKRTNGFGFRKKSTATSPSTPSTPPRPSTKQVNPTTPTTPIPRAVGVPNNREKVPSTPPSKRKAAIRAQSNVQKIIEADEAFHTEEEIHRASAREPPRRDDKSTAELGTRLRSISITPVPTGTRFREGTVADESVYTREKFLKDRAAGGQRLANRTRDIGKLVGEDSDEDCEDLDTSELFFVGGIILGKGQKGRLTDV